MKLLARLEPEARAVLLANCCICPWVVTFRRTPEPIIFEKLPVIFKQHQGESIRQQDGKQSIEF